MNEPYQTDSSYDEQSLDEQKRRERRAHRIQQMKKEKERQILIQKCVLVGVPVAIVVIVIALFATHCGKTSDDEASVVETSETIEIVNPSTEQKNDNVEPSKQQDILPAENTVSLPSDTASTSSAEKELVFYSAESTASTITLGEEVVSSHALFIDLDSDTILAQKSAKTIISPASMTKVLTLLVAAEQIQASQLDDTFTMTLEITDYSYVNDCSNVGFLDGEVVTVRDLFYGTALQSGGDAAVGLATYIAGSHEAFIDMMNDKLEELGLSETAHVTNCVGLYDEEHHCTAYDMAMIMEAAIANDICREVMSARTYTTSFTEQHPEGISISNWFIRRIEDKDTGGKVVCAKTGYVVQSGSCAVSYGTDLAGKEYICVTADANSSWRCIYDHVALYKMFAMGEQ